MAGQVALQVESFGYEHLRLAGEQPPKADVTVDVSDWFRDPHTIEALKQMDGRDQPVIDKVMDTPGVRLFCDDLAGLAICLLQQRRRTVVVAVGCVGGRHRSVVIADRVVTVAERCGYTAESTHLHVDRPVIQREVPDAGR